MIAQTPEPPYYAVIFTSVRTDADPEAYDTMSARMMELAAGQPGFLGAEAARQDTGITVSYWADLDAIRAWKRHAEHRVAQRNGRTGWYQAFTTRIARVERAYSFALKDLGTPGSAEPTE